LICEAPVEENFSLTKFAILDGLTEAAGNVLNVATKVLIICCCCCFFLFFFRYQDGHNKAWFAILSTMKWLAIRLDMICVIFVPFVVFLAIATHVGTGKQK